MTRQTRLTHLATAAVVALAGLVGGATAAAGEQQAAHPGSITGMRPIDTTSLYLLDQSRRDPALSVDRGGATPADVEPVGPYRDLAS